ncbi:MAG: CPBP family intramembrane metalloprotease [Phycisphaerales bacterium]|nr:CPBP family intramembrane metalloprotease [Phycisphaerales bacterium]
MTDDPQRHPVFTPPVAPLIVARPVHFLPYARAIVWSFPDVEMTRRQAVADLLLAFVAFAFAYFGLDLLLYLLFHEDSSFSPFWTAVPLGLTILLFVGGVLYARKQAPVTLGLGKPPWAVATVGTLLAVPACYASVMVVGITYVAIAGFEETVEDRRELLEILPEPGVWSLLVIGPFTGLHEEVLFRGFILTRMVVLFRSKVAAIVASSILFGVAHVYQGVAGIFQTAAIGMVLATLVTLTRSLWPAIVAHGVFNSLQLAMMPIFRGFLENAESFTDTPAG